MSTSRSSSRSTSLSASSAAAAAACDDDDDDNNHNTMEDSDYAGDARAMSPRRSGHEVERLSQEMRRAWHEKAETLQEGLRNLLDRVEHARSEYDKLEADNRFLQSYIGELMATSKITSTGTGRSSKAR